MAAGVGVTDEEARRLTARAHWRANNVVTNGVAQRVIIWRERHRRWILEPIRWVLCSGSTVAAIIAAGRCNCDLGIGIGHWRLGFLWNRGIRCAVQVAAQAGQVTGDDQSSGLHIGHIKSNQAALACIDREVTAFIHHMTQCILADAFDLVEEVMHGWRKGGSLSGQHHAHHIAGIDQRSMGARQGCELAGMADVPATRQDVGANTYRMNLAGAELAQVVRFLGNRGVAIGHLSRAHNAVIVLLLLTPDHLTQKRQAITQRDIGQLEAFIDNR